MLAKERHGENIKKIYIFSVAATIRPLRKWYHTWLCHVGLVNSPDAPLTCIYGGGRFLYVGSTTIHLLLNKEYAEKHVYHQQNNHQM